MRSQPAQDRHRQPGEGAANRRPSEIAAQADPDGHRRRHAGARRPATGQGLHEGSGADRRSRTMRRWTTTDQLDVASLGATTAPGMPAGDVERDGRRRRRLDGHRHDGRRSRRGGRWTTLRPRPPQPDSAMDRAIRRRRRRKPTRSCPWSRSRSHRYRRQRRCQPALGDSQEATAVMIDVPAEAGPVMLREAASAAIPRRFSKSPRATPRDAASRPT